MTTEACTSTSNLTVSDFSHNGVMGMYGLSRPPVLHVSFAGCVTTLLYRKPSSMLTRLLQWNGHADFLTDGNNHFLFISVLALLISLCNWYPLAIRHSILQLRCCAVKQNGWEIYRTTKWYELFGAKDGQTQQMHSYGMQYMLKHDRVVEAVYWSLLGM